MIRSEKIKRRRFLSAAALVVSSACARKAGPSFRTLTAPEAATLTAVCDCLIPPDRDAGASQAGVVRYIDIQLTRRFRGLRESYREGLGLIDAAARERHGRPFTELDAGSRTALLQEFEKQQGAQRRFFDMVLAHTMQGFYGNPRHGGNREGLSWKMLGVPHPPVRGRLHYEVA